MPPLHRAPEARLALAVVVLALGALGFVPLFAGPGYEMALAAGLVIPGAVATCVALEASRLRAEPFDTFCRGVATGGVLAAAGYVVALLHGARAGFCDLLGGSALYALGPGVGALLAGAWGALAGEVAGGRGRQRARRAVAVVLALFGPVASAALSVSRFYTSPMIFAYDPFAGYFSGTLYDTVIDASGLYTYRAGSLASLFSAFVVALHLDRDERGRLTFRAIGRPGLLVLGAVTLAGSVGSIFHGPRLSHWQTSASIAAELGAMTSGTRCDVIHPRSLPRADAERFARDCDGHVVQAERFFEAPGPPRLTAFLFADAAQKRRLMGASDTYIAKPWRRELYVHAAPYPHPALGHEVAHVVAGAHGRGPFRVAGGAGGLLPDPGLIEGLAVAASPRDGELTPAEWARAMKDGGLLPPLRSVFGLGFLGDNSARSYTVAGAFVEFVRQTRGAAALRRWYGGEPLERVAGGSLVELEVEWLRGLDALKLPDAARAQAKALFDRPAVFARRCPHVIDAERERADALRAAGDLEGAVQALLGILALDPRDGAARVALAGCRMRAGQVSEATAELAAIAADGALSRTLRDRALEQLGDRALEAGDAAGALARYAEVEASALDEDLLRTLEIKGLAAREEGARAAVLALLLPVGDRAAERLRAMDLLGAWSARSPREGVPDYLVARQLLAAGDLRTAGERLDVAVHKGLALPRVKREALRLRVIAACGLGEAGAAVRAYTAWSAEDGISEARRASMRSLLERCTGGAPAPPPPSAAAPEAAPIPAAAAATSASPSEAAPAAAETARPASKATPTPAKRGKRPATR